MKKIALIAASGSMLVCALPVAAAELPAPASPYAAAYTAATSPFAEVASYHDDDDDDDWRDRRGRDDRRWRDGRGRWNDRGGRDYWRGDDGRWRCRRPDGTVGLLIGAGVGALVGRQVDRRGDRTLGTILGAVGGGLLGREIDRGGARCR